MAHMRTCQHCGDSFTGDDSDDSLQQLVEHIRSVHPEEVTRY